MKIFITIYLILGLQIFAVSQVFNKSFELNIDAGASFNIQHLDSNKYMLIPTNFGSGNLGFSTVLTNSIGDTLGHNNFFSSQYGIATGGANSTSNTTDGGFIMGGGIAIRSQDRGMLIKFNALGDTLWTKQFGDTTNFRTFRQAIPTSDGGFAVVGEYAALGQRSDGWLVKTDSLGNLEWERYYSVSLGTLERLSSVYQCNDGSYILGGGELELPNQNTRNYDPIVIKVDSLGNQQWRYKYDTPANDAVAYAIQTQDGNFVFATSISVPEPAPYAQVSDSKAALLKLNSSGSLMWVKQYGHVASNHSLQVVKELANGDLIAAGRRRDNIDYTLEGLLLKTKANGDSIWVKTYEHDANGIVSENYLWDVIQMPDGGFMAAGEVLALPPHVPVRQDPWFIRVDSNGCNIQSCLIGINDKKSIIKELELWPNPTTGFVNIEGKEIRNISIFNAQGKLISIIENPKNNFEVPEVDGIYFLQIELSSGIIIKRKLIKN